MNALDLLKLAFGGALPFDPAVLAAIPSVKLTDWTVSHNSVRKGPVTDAKVGLKDATTFWMSASFEVEGVAHTLTAERPLMGGASVMTFDGAAVTGHIALRKHFILFPPRVRLEVDFDLGADVFRFDARVD